MMGHTWTTTKSACHLDVIGSGSEEDVQIGLKYYDDEDERFHWQQSFPGYPIPDHAAAL